MNRREEIAKIIDGEAWKAADDGRDRIVGSLWENRRLWARNKADAILDLISAGQSEQMTALGTEK